MGDDERAQLAENLVALRSSECTFVEKAVAAAWGAGLPAERPVASMVVDVGAATTEVAVVTLNGIAAGHVAPVGGDDLSRAITRHLLEAHGLLVGERTAEAVKRTVGSAVRGGGEKRFEVGGCDARSGFPKSVYVRSAEISEALAAPLAALVAAVKRPLAEMPPELAADLLDRGITLTGGGSLLPGLPELLRRETDHAVFRAEAPLICAALGALRMVGVDAPLDSARTASVDMGLRSRAEEEERSSNGANPVASERFVDAPLASDTKAHAPARVSEDGDVRRVNVFTRTYRRRRNRRIDAAVARAREALERSRSHDDWEGEAAALTQLGLAALERGDHRAAVEPLHEALSISRALHDETREIELLAYLATAHKEIDFEKAVHFGRAALAQGGPTAPTSRQLVAWLPLEEDAGRLEKTEEIVSPGHPRKVGAGAP